MEQKIAERGQGTHRLLFWDELAARAKNLIVAIANPVYAL